MQHALDLKNSIESHNCEAMQFLTTFPVSEPTRLKMGEELGPAAAYSAQVIISVLKFIHPVYPIFRWLPG